MKITIFQGDVTDVSAKKEALLTCGAAPEAVLCRTLFKSWISSVMDITLLRSIHLSEGLLPVFVQHWNGVDVEWIHERFQVPSWLGFSPVHVASRVSACRRRPSWRRSGTESSLQTSIIGFKILGEMQSCVQHTGVSDASPISLYV